MNIETSLRMPVRRRGGQGKIVSPMVWAVALLAALGTSPVEAISPDLSLTQLGHSAWRVQDGVLPGAPTAIAQTKDGYIWIGTQAGLVRFDGVALVPVSPPPSQTPHSTRITALHGARDGSLWIGTGSQVMRWRAGKFHLYDTPVGVYVAVGEAPEGKIWVARMHTPDDLGALCEVRESDLKCYGAQQGLPFKNATALAIEESGAIWVGASSKLARWHAGQSQIFAPSELSGDEQLEGYKSVVIARDGSVWSGAVNGGPGLGLQHFANGAWSPVISAGVDTSTWEVTTLLFDRDGTLWVGTANRGIYRVNGSRIDHFGVSDGLSADSVNGFCEDQEGNVWAVTTNGIDKFRPTQVVTFSSRQGLSADSVNAVLAAKSGAIWVSNGALEKIQDGAVTTYRERDGFRGKQVTALFEDSQDRLWVGADDGVAVHDGKHFTQVRSAGRPIGAILEFAQGPPSTVWAITILPSRLVRMSDAEVLESVPPPSGARIATLASGPDGALWMTVTGKAADCDLARYAAGQWETFALHNPPYSGACSEVVVRDDHTVYISEPLGIVGWRDGVLRKLTPENGLPCARAISLVFDRHGNLWVYLQCGVAVIESQQLADWWNEPAKKLQIRLLDTSDGALPAPPDFHPRAAVGVDDKVWFANSADLQFVDPQHPLRNPVVPPVQILTLRGDGRTFSLASPIALPPLTRDVKIEFTALSFVVPQRVRFQYRLEGWDRDWQTAGSPREAVYTNLRPGKYRFSVLASNDDGLWNTTGDTLEFTIEPAFYQSWWFRWALGALLGLLGWGLYAYRVRNITRQFAIRLDERVSERSRIARELHDSLLQSFQGLLLRFQTVYELLPQRPADAKETLANAIDRTAQAITEGREAVQGLRASTVESNDLAMAITSLGEELAADAGAETSSGLRVQVEGTARSLHPMVRDEILRIAAEAVRNAFRHAGAKLIEVELRYDERQLRLRVRDDGQGIDLKFSSAEGPSGHFGLHGMRERAELVGGKLTVWSSPGSGTEIELTIPAARAYAKSAPPRRAWFGEKRAEKSSQSPS